MSVSGRLGWIPESSVKSQGIDSKMSTWFLRHTQMSLFNVLCYWQILFSDYGSRLWDPKIFSALKFEGNFRCQELLFPNKIRKIKGPGQKQADGWKVHWTWGTLQSCCFVVKVWYTRIYSDWYSAMVDFQYVGEKAAFRIIILHSFFLTLDDVMFEYIDVAYPSPGIYQPHQ